MNVLYSQIYLLTFILLEILQ